MSVGLRAARGAAWTILSSVGGRGLGLISTLILTRFVTPKEYGAVSLASAIGTSADQFTRFGLFQYILARPEPDREAAWHATFYHLSVGLLAFGVVALMRNPLSAWFIGSAEMSAFVLGTLVSCVFDRLAVPPERILSRDLRFGVMSAARATAELTYAVLSVVLAVFGLGGWAIVHAGIAKWALFALVLVRVTPWRDWLQVGPLRWGPTRTLFSFGLPLAVGHVANFAARRWDNLLLGHFFGAAMVGRYNLAYNLADIPATHVGEHIGDVLLPSFARMDAEERVTALVRATALLGLVVFPLAVGLGAVAQTLTLVVFDARWAAMAPMITLLCALSVFRPIGWTVTSYLQARQRPKTVMGLEVGTLAVLLGGIAICARFGELWACSAVGLAFALQALCSLWIIRALDGIPVRRMLLAVGPPLVACAPLAGAVLGVRHLLGPLVSGPSVLMLLAEIMAGTVVFVPAAWVLAPRVSREFVALLRRAISRRQAAPAPTEEPK